MLREHYPIDKLFEEVLGYIPDLSPGLVKTDTYLEDQKLYGYSYEETQRQASDSLRLRQVWRVYLKAVPDDTPLMRWTNLIQANTLEKFYQRITQLAIERNVTRGRKLRTDGTLVESNSSAQ